MIPIEQQVCSRELAKRLKELGVRQESHFWWVKDCDEIKGWRVIGLNEICGELDSHVPFSYEYMKDCERMERFSAFTVAELGEMLPKGSYSQLCEYKGKWTWQVNTPLGSFANGFQREMTEADARAKMLIYLIENGYVKAEDVQ
jgi:hypothetical protein